MSKAFSWAIQHGVLEAPGGLCRPDGTFTRAEMAKHLVLIQHGTNFSAPTTPYFSDVPPSHPYFKFVQKLREDEITVGCSNAGDKFCPDELATNAHGASLSVRTRYPQGQFPPASPSPYYVDVPPSHWGFPTIQKIHEDKAAASCAVDRYCPDEPINRGKWVTVLYSYFAGP
jgi:hypothetical protein